MTNLSEITDLNGSAAARMIRQVFPQHEWQPISTAPKDGRRLIGAFEDYDYIQVVGTITWRPFAGEPARWWFEDINDTSPVNPTHWMPLPEPPK